ncbi:hypothetical protein [Terribacillus aidingensis]|nr:hypothetical protein [Terribacillus aidingensis]
MKDEYLDTVSKYKSQTYDELSAIKDAQEEEARKEIDEYDESQSE